MFLTRKQEMEIIGEYLNRLKGCPMCENEKQNPDNNYCYHCGNRLTKDTLENNLL